MKSFNRRQFLAAGSALGIAASASISGSISALHLLAEEASGANDVIRFALIGAGPRGNVLGTAITQLKNMKLVAVCDVDSERLAAAKKNYGVEKAFTDMRKIFDDPEIDAVAIATCNHWHCLAAIWAMQAGKHVYLEKPLCLSFWEGQQLINATKKYGKFCQIGTQMRTDDELHPAAKKLLHEDPILGKIQSVRVNRFWPRRSIGLRTAPLVPPANTDYNLWLGPAKDLPLFRNQLHYDWHWMWNTGNGETGNWGAHLLDDCRNDVLQNKIQIPKRVFTLGARVGYQDAGDSPNTLLTWFETGSFPVIFAISGLEAKEKRHFTGRLEGPNSGYVVYCEGGRYEKYWGGAHVFDAEGKEIMELKGNSESYGAYPHLQNFVDSILANKKEMLNAEINVGFDSSFWINSANTSYRLAKEHSYAKAKLLERPNLGKMPEILDAIEEHMASQGVSMEAFRLSSVMELDPATRRFVGPDAEAANELMEFRPGRNEFVVPEIQI